MNGTQVVAIAWGGEPEPEYPNWIEAAKTLIT